MEQLDKGIATGLIGALIFILFFGWHLNRQDRLALEAMREDTRDGR